MRKFFHRLVESIETDTHLTFRAFSQVQVGTEVQGDCLSCSLSSWFYFVRTSCCHHLRGTFTSRYFSTSRQKQFKLCVPDAVRESQETRSLCCLFLSSTEFTQLSLKLKVRFTFCSLLCYLFVPSVVSTAAAQCRFSFRVEVPSSLQHVSQSSQQSSFHLVLVKNPVRSHARSEVTVFTLPKPAAPLKVL